MLIVYIGNTTENHLTMIFHWSRIVMTQIQCIFFPVKYSKYDWASLRRSVLCCKIYGEIESQLQYDMGMRRER